MNIKPLKEELSEEERVARSQKLVDDYFKKVGDARTKEQREEDLKKAMYYTPKEAAERIKELEEGPPYELWEDFNNDCLAERTREELIAEVKKYTRP